MTAGLKLSGLAGLLITWSVTYYNLAELRLRSEREAWSNLEILARITEEQVFQNFRALDQTLLSLRHAVEQRRADFSIRDWLSHNRHLDRSIRQISVSSEDGAVTGVALTGSADPIEAAEHAGAIRDFSAHQHSGQDALLISRPAEEPPGQISFQMSRPILARDGGFAGVAMIAIDSNYLRGVYEKVGIGRLGVITLVGTDGAIIAQARRGHPGGPVLLVGQTLFEHLAQSSSGVYRNTSEVDGVTRLFAYRQVRDMPMVVNIGRAQDELLADYYETRNTHVLGSIAASAVLCVLIVLIGMQQDKRRRAELELRARDLQYRLIADDLQQVLFQIDFSRRVTFISDAWSVLTGKPLAEALGTSFERLVERAHREAIRTFFDRFIDGPAHLRSCEARLQTNDGAERWVEVRAYRSDNAAEPAIVGTLTDITQRHDAERRAELAKQELLERQYALDQAAIVAITDADGRITYVNDMFCKVSGYEKEELIGQNHRILKSGLHPDDFFRGLYRQISNGRVWRGEICNRAKDGSLHWLDTTIVPRMGPNGSPVSYMTIRIDVTRRKAVEQALRESQEDVLRKSEQLHTALANINQGLSMFDAEQKLVVCNSQYAELYGHAPEDVSPGTSLKEIVNRRIELGIYGDDWDTNIRDVLNPTDNSRFFQQLRNGRIIEVSRQRMANGGWVTTHKDVTESRRLEAQMQYLARHDVLTGLANRALFVEEVKKALARKPPQDVALFIIDLDRFKEINDVFGHVCGDELLKSVAKRIRECAEDGAAVLARLGGDEFAILHTAEGDVRESALTLAGRLVERISEPYIVDNSEAFIGASIGIALARDCGHDAGRLIRNADLALYRMKADGRNGFRFFDREMETEATRRGALALDLERGIKQGEFELYYQPILDARSMEVCGMEALARWRHPKHGLISPDDFIPLAEESGAIAALGEWILVKACQDAAAWPPEIKIAVNLSPAQFRRGKLLDIVIAALVESGLAPERLELEITESVVLQKHEANFAVLHQLRSLGVAVVLDDFGTGYSSLSYIRAFPFDKIKIDKSFIKELANRSDCAAIVCAITGLARALNITTTAEGVETQEQFELSRAAGCTQMQGYLFGRPQRASDIRLMDFQTKWGRAA